MIPHGVAMIRAGNVFISGESLGVIYELRIPREDGGNLEEKKGEGRSERESCRVTKRLYIFPVDGTRDGEGRGGKEDDNRTGYDV